MPPKFRDPISYCDNTGWMLVRNTDHWYYEKLRVDGILLRTKISHAVAKEIPNHLWQHILKKQLQTTQEEFDTNR